MIALQPDFGKASLKSPVVIFLMALAVIHLVTFVPAMFAQKEYQEKILEFKTLWNTGGSMLLSKQGIDPTKAEEELRRQAFLKTHVEKSFFYRVWFVPMWAGAPAYLFSWILSPGWFSLLLAVWVLLYGGVWLEKTWSRVLVVPMLIGLSIAGTFVYAILISGLLEKHLEIPYSGIGLASAFVVGILARRHQGSVPLFGWLGKPVQKSVHPYLFACIFVAVDFVVQLFLNPINYGWVFALDLCMIGLGWTLSLKLPIKEIITAEKLRAKFADPLAPVRAQLQEGWRLAELLELEASLSELDKALNSLMSSLSPDRKLIEETLLRMLHFKNAHPVSSEQWYRWGVRCAEIGVDSAAIECLEKAATSPGATLALARPAVVQAAEIRVKNDMKSDASKALLERVIKASATDLIGRRAVTVLEAMNQK